MRHPRRSRWAVGAVAMVASLLSSFTVVAGGLETLEALGSPPRPRR